MEFEKVKKEHILLGIKEYVEMGLANELLEKIISDAILSKFKSVSAYIDVLNEKGTAYLDSKGLIISGQIGVVMAIKRLEY